MGHALVFEFIKDACAGFSYFVHTNLCSFPLYPHVTYGFCLKVATQLFNIGTTSESPSLTTSVSGLGEVPFSSEERTQV